MIIKIPISKEQLQFLKEIGITPQELFDEELKIVMGKEK